MIFCVELSCAEVPADVESEDGRHKGFEARLLTSEVSVPGIPVVSWFAIYGQDYLD